VVPLAIIYALLKALALSSRVLRVTSSDRRKVSSVNDKQNNGTTVTKGESRFTVKRIESELSR
jgi:hypothetical protein